ncbi:SDR family oxidoreductase [Candidatus Uabimicrobium amorphum]|uniref:Short chain dehydrogenase n=1 Tax=Uabimicrobium amorphum TaxID=2596890 RepID=A0A5S9F480_UABAM|nr:SDR family oxidoreductase [Candidatus Uabimicrobium amorphum]BBM84309.1 short chain dehydrogenase [Candidatus Uabimicrobium amorphum]
MNKRNFKGKVVVITGACGGLGKSLCTVFGKNGATIIAADIDAQGIKELCDELQKDMNIDGYVNDVTNDENVREIAKKVLQKHKRIDVLINNAGISHLSKFSETSVEVMHRVININLFGCMYWAAACIDSIIENKGMMIALSSVAGFAPLHSRTMYAASKHALHGCFESLRAEVEDDGVDVMMVCPAFIATKINDNALSGDGKPAQKNRVHAGKKMSPDYVAQIIYTAATKRKKTLLIGRVSKLAYLVSRFSKNTYIRAMKKKFANELKS